MKEKVKKIICMMSAILILFSVIIILSNTSNANGETQSYAPYTETEIEDNNNDGEIIPNNNKIFKITVNVDKTSLKTGEEFEVQVNINEMNNIKNGIIAFSGILEYDSNILEMISMESQNGWDQNTYNEDNFKFVTTNNKFITEASTIFKIKFKVKDNIVEAPKTTVKIKNITSSNGEYDITAEDAAVDVSVILEEKTNITSEKYNVQEEEKCITKILPTTTSKDFLANIETNKYAVIIDKNGNEISEDTIIGTGMILKAGELEFSLVVTGDLDGDGAITLTDLAKIRLHIIEKETLTGPYYKAADITYDTNVTLTDIARIKLTLVGLHVIE